MLIVYKGKFKEKNIIYTRCWSMPTPWTFSMTPVKALLKKYVGNGKCWIDPFAGKYSPAEITNDNNPERKAKYCMEAIDFVKQLSGQYNGILFDPPYSFTQIKKHYQNLFGRKLQGDQHKIGFYEKVKTGVCEKIKVGGYAISFGWNTNGFGKARGFKIIEIMSIAHGGGRNDTTVVIEKKIN
jgi:hypothetical protein